MMKLYLLVLILAAAHGCQLNGRQIRALPECTEAENDTATTDAEGCPVCRDVKGVCTRQERNNSPLCDADTINNREILENGCPSCILSRCSREARANIPTCTADQTPERDSTTGCRSCRRPRCEDRQSVPDCAEGVRPSRNSTTGCPTCKPSPVDRCPRGSQNTPACRARPPCGPGVTPTRGDDCCLSCRPGRPRCNRAARIRCLASLEADELPLCADIEIERRWNPLTCCPNCRRGNGTKTGGACSKEQFQQCRDRTHTCQAREEAFAEPGLCCRSCNRRSVEVSRRAKCGEIPECGEDPPTRIEGEGGAFHCPSCRLPRPTCDPECGDRQRCARAANATTICRPRSLRRRFIRALRRQDRGFIRNATEAELQEALVAIVARFCERQDDAVQRVCQNQVEFVSSIVVRIVARRENDDDEVEVEIDSTEETTDLLAAALESDEEFSFHEHTDPSEPSAASHISASLLLALVLMLF